MHRRSFLAAGLLAVGAVSFVQPVVAETAPRLSGPFVHDNLAVYLVHGASRPGPTPLTLAEAMAKGLVKVHETRDVNRLAIENTGKADVFIQSGDIVKGGQQDRVLTSSLLLTSGSGRVPIEAFCVEQGRWSQRGTESVRTFETSSTTISSRDAKLAIKTAGKPTDVARVQQEVWRSVEKTQTDLTTSLGRSVAAPASSSSLQLTLENTTLAAARAAYVRALKPIAEQEPDVVGFVFAINGRLEGAEIYPANGLFRKMWTKLLEASATEAVGARKREAAAPPSLADVTGFLAAAETGQATARGLPTQGDLVTRDSPRAVFVEASAKSGGWFHRSYVAK
ncbi:MAG: hypothetical protein FJX57_12125 [Alphaproteobacteria bacterium]|nr:hypothetical protein [Alphaproteobacteria bacterium]